MDGGVERLSVALRILIHLIPYARFENELFCPREMTQRGMAASLGVGRPFVSKTLKILMEKGFVECKLKHPLDLGRLEKAYLLTVAGMGLATSLRLAIKVRAEAMAGGETHWEAPKTMLPARARAAGA